MSWCSSKSTAKKDSKGRARRNAIRRGRRQMAPVRPAMRLVISKRVVVVVMMVAMMLILDVVHGERITAVVGVLVDALVVVVVVGLMVGRKDSP